MNDIYSFSSAYTNEFIHGPISFIASMIAIMFAVCKVIILTFNYIKDSELKRKEGKINFFQFWFFFIRPIDKKYIKSNKTGGVLSAILYSIMSLFLIYLFHMVIGLYQVRENSAFMSFKKDNMPFILFKDKIESTNIINPLASKWSIYFTECSKSNIQDLSIKHKLSPSEISNICSLKNNNNYEKQIKIQIDKYQKDRKIIMSLVLMMVIYVSHMTLGVLFGDLNRRKTISKNIKTRAEGFFILYNSRKETENLKIKEIERIEKNLGIINYNTR